MKRNSKNKTTDRKEVITNRIMVIIVISFAIIFGFMQLYNFMIQLDTMPYVNTLLWSLFGASCAGVIAGVIFFLSRKKRGVDERMLTFTSRGIIAVSGFLAVTFLLIRQFYVEALSAMYIVIPVLCALYIIFYVYNMDFFWLATFAALTAAALWGKDFLYAQNHPTLSRVEPWAMAVLLALFLIGTLFVRKNGGILTFGGQRFLAYKRKALYWPVLVGLVVDIAALALASVMGGNFVTFGLIAVGAYTLLAAIFFTVRLMYD